MNEDYDYIEDPVAAWEQNGYTQEQCDIMNDEMERERTAALQFEHRGLCNEIPFPGTSSICYAGLDQMVALDMINAEALMQTLNKSIDDFLVSCDIPSFSPKKRKVMTSRSEASEWAAGVEAENAIMARNYGKNIISSRD